jgi:hypothetical protein
VPPFRASPDRFKRNAERRFSMGEYDLVSIGAYKTDRRTAVMVRRVEKQLGVSLPVYQGSYNAGGVAASGGTHDRGGVLDLGTPTGRDPDAITRQLRNAGFAAWYRTPAQGFSYHIHCVDIGNQRLAFNAGLQVGNYQSGGSGLWPLEADNDPQPYRPTNLQFYPFVTRDGFDWDAYQASLRLRDRIKELGRKARQLLRRKRKAQKQLDRLS